MHREKNFIWNPENKHLNNIPSTFIILMLKIISRKTFNNYLPHQFWTKKFHNSLCVVPHREALSLTFYVFGMTRIWAQILHVALHYNWAKKADPEILITLYNWENILTLKVIITICVFQMFTTKSLLIGFN